MKNQIIEWLSIGDLRSDGQANEVTALVLAQPAVFPDLLQALTHENDAVRGHAADALEKVSRERPDLILPELDLILQAALTDPIPMVRWHLAMVLGALVHIEELAELIIPTLIDMLADKSAFVKGWCISSLLIWGRRHPAWRNEILQAFTPLRHDKSIAVRHRVEKAINLLLNEHLPIPDGWVKSQVK